MHYSFVVFTEYNHRIFSEWQRRLATEHESLYVMFSLNKNFPC
jgi:hypothetical protein